MEKSRKTAKPERLSMTFHRSFTLVRPAIGQILRLAVSQGEQSGERIALSKKLIREHTNLGSVYVEAMPRYAWATGLLSQDLSITDFGLYVAQHDPMLMNAGTQWLMHYNISSSYGSGPSFWNAVIIERFRTGNTFRKSEIDSEILTHYIKDNPGSVSLDSAQQTATAFLGTYTKSDGLGQLQLLRKLETGDYRVLLPIDVPAWAFAYALMSFWDSAYAGRLSVNLDELTEAHGLASLFLMDKASLNSVLNELQRAGIVDVYRADKPYQLLLLSHDKEMVLRNLYGVH